MTYADTLERPTLQTTDTPGDAAHIVLVPPGEPDATPQAYVLRSRIEGFAITALCGYTWTPHRNPAPLPACSKCVDVYQNDPHGHGDRDDLPDA